MTDAVANLTNLFLVNGARREQEFVTRRALGASRGRIVRQVLTEALVVAAAGAVLGVLAAVVSVTFTDSLLWLRAKFKAFNGLPRWAHPAIGGLATGVLAVVGFELFHLNGIAGDPYKTLGIKP